MELILGEILSFVLLYKYTALFLVSLLAAFLLPLPSSTTLAAAGAFAAQGYLNIYLVLLIAFLGNVMGDGLAYFIAKYYGEEILNKIGFRKILHSKLYLQITEYMINFSYSLIFISRFLTEIGPAVSIFSGLTKMSVKKFFTIDIIGEICYVLLYGITGYILGNQWEDNIWFIFEAGALVLSFGAIIAMIQYKMFKKRLKLN